MMSSRDAAAAAAIHWLARQHEPSFDDWEAFTVWLEEDPVHAAEYQRLMALDADVTARLSQEGRPSKLPPDPVSEQICDRPRRRFAALKGFGLAVVCAILALVWLRPGSEYEVATATGQRKHLLLEDGSRVVLDGATRIRLDRDAVRTVEIESGEALFDIRHDADRPFQVRFSGGKVQNLGTRFTVARTDSETRIAVAEGAVAFSDGSRRVELRPGEALVQRGSTVRTGRVAIDQVGRFATPRLTYDNAPLAKVAKDLSRELGVEVEVAPTVATRRVTASVTIDLDTERGMARLGALLGVDIQRRGAGWRIAAVE